MSLYNASLVMTIYQTLVFVMSGFGTERANQLVEGQL